MNKLLKRKLLILILSFALLTEMVKSEQFFITEDELDELVQSGTKVRIGVLSLPLIPDWASDVLSKPDSAFSFFYKKKSPSDEILVPVKDAKLRAAAVQHLKKNISKVLHLPFKYFSWLFGPQNLVNFSQPQDISKLKSYAKLLEVVPIDLYASPENLKLLLGDLDGVLFTGGPNDMFKSQTLQEFTEYFYPSGEPRSFPKHRISKPLLACAKIIVSEVQQINSSGRFIPLWGTCQGFQLIAMASGSPELNMDSFDDDNGNLRLAKSVDRNWSVEDPKPNSLSKMMLQEIKETGNFFPYYHHMGYTKQTLQNDKLFINDYNILYSSSQNNFEYPQKSHLDPFRRPEDRYFLNPDKLNPEYVAIFEHKSFPIYATQFHPEIFFDYIKKYDFTTIKKLREVNITFSKFFVSMILKNNLNLGLKDDSSDLCNVNYDETNCPEETKIGFEFYEKSIKELLPFYKNKFIQDILKYENRIDSMIWNNTLEADTGTANVANNPLDQISSMAFVQKLSIYDYAGLLWKE